MAGNQNKSVCPDKLEDIAFSWKTWQSASCAGTWYHLTLFIDIKVLPSDLWLGYYALTYLHATILPWLSTYSRGASFLFVRSHLCLIISAVIFDVNLKIV
jgi:hypothetical protein